MTSKSKIFLKYFLIINFIFFFKIPLSISKNQHCDIKIITTKTLDSTGNVTNVETTEKVICDDKNKEFYEQVGLAETCEFFYWQMPIGNKKIKKRSIACKTSDGNYEIIQNFNTID